jgi:hypothetical protein
MFSEQDLQAAIDAGIFSKTDDVLACPAEIIRFFERWALAKCKETSRNVRYSAAEICEAADCDEDNAPALIANILDRDVIPGYKTAVPA